MKIVVDDVYACVLSMATQAFGSFREARVWASRPFLGAPLMPPEVAETPEGMKLVKAELCRVLERRLASAPERAADAPLDARALPGEHDERRCPRGLNQYEL